MLINRKDLEGMIIAILITFTNKLHCNHVNKQTNKQTLKKNTFLTSKRRKILFREGKAT